MKHTLILRKASRAIMVLLAALGVAIFALPVFINSSVAIAQPMVPQSTQAQDEHPSISNLLSPDGSLRRGAMPQGSFDAQGYRMRYGANGEPQFIKSSSDAPASRGSLLAALPGDEFFSTQFSSKGLNADVYAIAVAANGDVYVGGDFVAAGGVAGADYIARWNGSAWNALGSGLNRYVNVITINGTDVYVGGNFDNTGDNSATGLSNIARWDGAQWHPLANGVNSAVYAIAAQGSSVYVGGNFGIAFNSASSSLGANCIAKWNGAQWDSLGGGLNATVRALAVKNDTVYAGGLFTRAGGSFTTADGIVANRIARWTGTKWDSLGSGINPTSFVYVSSIATDENSVYVSGQFSKVGNDVSAQNVARWNGSTWNTLGSGLNSFVDELTISGGMLYAAGVFTASGSTPINRLAKWNGTAWSIAGDALTGGGVYGLNVASALAVSGTNIYLGGNFTGVRNGGIDADYLLQWNGSAWSGLTSGTGMGLNEDVLAVAVSGDDIYVGGFFLNAGGVAGADYIARWNGSTWNALGSGLNGIVYTIAVEGTDVYVGGVFGNTGDNSATDLNYIARWDGSTWNPLGAGLNNAVNALAFSGNTLYAGGQFTRRINATGTDSLKRIAKWDGVKWDSLGAGIAGGDYSAVSAIAVQGTNVYVGGYFKTAGGLPIQNIAKWNGVKWDSLGGLLNGNEGVSAIAVSGSDVYVGGYFYNAGGNTNLSNIAQWNGTTWNTVGSGLGNAVSALAVKDGNLYAAGYFSSAINNSILLNRLAKWDGATWTPFGSGLSGAYSYAYAFAFGNTATDSSLYIGGNFLTAGGKPSSYFARWTGSVAALATDDESPSAKPQAFTLSQNYPNPFNPNTVVSYQLSVGSDVQLKVFDVLGREVQTLVNQKQAAGNYKLNFNANKLASGIYFYRLQAKSAQGNFVQTKKMLLIK